MKPDWDRLGSEYADSSVLIGDVDCTADGESLCERFDVRGCKSTYPIIFLLLSYSYCKENSNSLNLIFLCANKWIHFRPNNQVLEGWRGRGLPGREGLRFPQKVRRR